MRRATCATTFRLFDMRVSRVACPKPSIGTPQHYSVPAKNRSMIAECSASVQPELSIDTHPL